MHKQWSYEEIVLFCVPACLCTGPRWPDPSLPLWKAWTETSSGAKLSSYGTLLEFICGVYTLCKEVRVKHCVFYVVYRSVSTSELSGNKRILDHVGHGGTNSLLEWPSLTTGEMAKQVILRLDRPTTRTKPYSTVVGNRPRDDSREGLWCTVQVPTP